MAGTAGAMRDRLLVLCDGFSFFRRRHPGVGRGLLTVVVAALVLTAITGVHALRSSPGGRATRDPTREVAAPMSAPMTPLPSLPSVTAKASHARTAARWRASDRPLQGQELAAAWLTGYLTRSDRSDERWVPAIQDLTTPELLETLQAEGPSAVGLDQLASWRVTRIAPFTAVEQPVDTASRTVLSYAAVVTDGHVQVEKPFQLYCYRAADGRWLVASIEQPYSSEG